MELGAGKLKVSGGAFPASGDAAMVALVGQGTEFEGTLKAGSGQVCLNASFKGTAKSDGTIFIDEQGDVEADVTARVVRVAGQLKGSVKALERLEIMAKGVIRGDVTTPVLVVEPGGYLQGQCHMPVPESVKPEANPAERREVHI
jgi:cytoskeletal protein CcmA (bactofilin family)